MLRIHCKGWILHSPKTNTTKKQPMQNFKICCEVCLTRDFIKHPCRQSAIQPGQSCAFSLKGVLPKHQMGSDSKSNFYKDLNYTDKLFKVGKIESICSLSFKPLRISIWSCYEIWLPKSCLLLVQPSCSHSPCCNHLLSPLRVHTKNSVTLKAELPTSSPLNKLCATESKPVAI